MRAFNASPKAQALHHAKQSEKPKRPATRHLTKAEQKEKTKDWPKQVGKFDKKKFYKSMGSEG